MAQGLRLHAPNAGDPGSIPGQENRFPHAVTKSLHAATKEDPKCHNKRFHLMHLSPGTAKQIHK